MLKSAMKQNCKPCLIMKREPGPSPQSQGRNQHLLLKPHLGPKAKLNKRQDLRICGVSLA